MTHLEPLLRSSIVVNNREVSHLPSKRNTKRLPKRLEILAGYITDDSLFFYATEVLSSPTLAFLLRKASVARVDRRLRRYNLIVLLLPNIFALACLPLSSI